MATATRHPLLTWTTAVPVLALVVLVGTWGRSLPVVVELVVALVLVGAVLSAVHHAEVIARRVGEPFGLLVLAVAAEEHAAPPTPRAALTSLGLLVAVVGLAKVESPAIEEAVAAVGYPQSVVGVVIALLVLLPETLAAARAARRDRLQISRNLAFGSAMAGIGLTIPAIAVASIWLDGPLLLGLGPTQVVLLAVTVVVGMLTVVPGRATRLQRVVHLVLLAAFAFLAVNP
ncbi:hypothetical protein [Geodermatophilus sp. SYSU D00815]